MRSGQVGILDWGSIRVFMFTDDLGWQLSDEKYKSSTADWREKSKLPSTTPDQIWGNSAHNLSEVLMAHHWREDIPFTYLDIGCQYGSWAIYTALLIDSAGYQNAVIAFDPGRAAELTPYNLALNHMQDRIVFERVAVGDCSLPTIVFAEDGHSENNRIVNRILHMENSSWVVDRTSIDHYVSAKNIKENLLVKVDTQGAEYEVMRGAEQTMQERFVTGIWEYIPGALQSRIDPAAFIAKLLPDYHVLDTEGRAFQSGGGVALAPIDKQTLRQFVKTVADSESGSADLLIYPRRLPAAERLLARITARAS